MIIKVGPDGDRYWAMAEGKPVSRPFHLRWVLPFFCGIDGRKWWFVWGISWPIAAAGMFAWRMVEGDAWQYAAAATAVLLALPGIDGPVIVKPIGIDNPATALTLVAVALAATGQPHMIIAAVLLMSWTAGIKETSPVFAALWAWCPWLLLALIPVGVRALVVKPGPDPLGPEFQEIADHPIRSAFKARKNRWRDAWLMVAPWGIGLLALVEPSPQLIVVLIVAYAQLLIATDTVRLVHHAAGPVVAAAAVAHLPVEWLLFAVVAQLMYWRVPERV